jgi:hypothetical protein
MHLVRGREVVEGGGLRTTPEAFGQRFESSKATAQLNLVYPPGKPIGRLQRLELEKTDPMMHRATNECELPESHALIVKSYAMSAPKMGSAIPIGAGSAAPHESKRR